MVNFYDKLILAEDKFEKEELTCSFHGLKIKANH